MERPPDRVTLPVIPERETDPITDGLHALTFTQLDLMLRQAWAARKPKDEHLVELAREQIPRIESEMVRRGLDIPEEPKEEEKPEAQERPKKKKRAKP